MDDTATSPTGIDALAVGKHRYNLDTGRHLPDFSVEANDKVKVLAQEWDLQQWVCLDAYVIEPSFDIGVNFYNEKQVADQLQLGLNYINSNDVSSAIMFSWSGMTEIEPRFGATLNYRGVEELDEYVLPLAISYSF